MRFFSGVAAVLGAGLLANAAAVPPETDRKLALEIYKEMVESKSGYTTGSTTPIAQSVAARMRAAGFDPKDIYVGGAAPNKMNVVVRYRGTGEKRAILLLAHEDVVEAKREDWSTDPFTFLEKDGFYYGRGTADDKAQAAVFVEMLIRMKREGFRPKRDLIVALTADEEGGGPFNGVEWLLAHHKDLIDAEFCLNEGGGGEMLNGKRISNDIQAGEKWYSDFRLEVRNKGGHSSQPVPDNAIYRLSAALVKIGQFGFPMKTNEVTRAYFTQMSKTELGQLQTDLAAAGAGSQDAMQRIAAQSPAWNSMLKTTCVATQLEGGHARNALPQLASANVNCRIMPDDSLDYVLSTLKRVVGDEQVDIKPDQSQVNSPASPLREDVMRAMKKISDTMWPGVVVLPVMSTGATDGRYLRASGIQTYGVQGFFRERNDNRSHGRDERMAVQSFQEGQTFLYDLVKQLAE